MELVNAKDFTNDFSPFYWGKFMWKSSFDNDGIYVVENEQHLIYGLDSLHYLTLFTAFECFICDILKSGGASNVSWYVFKPTFEP